MNNTLYAKPDYNLHRLQNTPAVDSSNFTTLLAAQPRGSIDCNGYETVKGFAKLTGGSTPTIDLQPLELANVITVPEFIIADSTISGLVTNVVFSVTINGGRLFLRIAAITGSPTKIEVFLAGAERSINDVGRRIS